MSPPAARHRAWARLALGLVAVWACMALATAADFGVSELQRLLAQQPARELAYRETRESPWLAAPVRSTGTLRSTADYLEKRVATPRVETWRLHRDRMEWLPAEGAQGRQIQYRDAPALAALGSALSQIVAGDLAALQRDFRLQLEGHESQWTLRLHPARPELARHLEPIELQGSRGRLQVITIGERSGERTTLQLDP